MTYMVKESKEWLYVGVKLIHFAAHQKLIQHCKSTICCCCLVAKSRPTFATPWTEDQQAALSMGFTRQEYWSGLPFPSLEDLSNPGIKLASPVWQVDSLPLSHRGSPKLNYNPLKLLFKRCSLCLPCWFHLKGFVQRKESVTRFYSPPKNVYTSISPRFSIIL